MLATAHNLFSTTVSGCVFVLEQVQLSGFIFWNKNYISCVPREGQRETYTERELGKQQTSIYSCPVTVHTQTDMLLQHSASPSSPAPEPPTPRDVTMSLFQGLLLHLLLLMTHINNQSTLCVALPLDRTICDLTRSMQGYYKSEH